MTLTEAQKILNEEIVYKNMSFYIQNDVYQDLIVIKSKAPVRDACSGYAYEAAPVIDIKSIESIDSLMFHRMEKEHFIHLIYNMCKRLEMHELMEHFKVNGEHLYDPHPENKKVIDK